MKNNRTMDYKKKYEEALERAKKYYDRSKLINPANVLDIIFPELAETEDEQARRTAINCVNWFGFDSIFFKDIAKENVLAYLVKLEKQKEQKPTVEEVLIKAGLKLFKDGNQWCILIGDNIQEGICGFGDTIEDALYHFLIETMTYQKEQKPVNVRFPNYNNIVDKVFGAGNLESWERDEAEALVRLAKEELLKDMQKPAEWSEEDEKYFDSIIESYKELIKDYSANHGVDYIPYNTPVVARTVVNDIKFLKSLRPQPHWKPSKEQMRALWEIYQGGKAQAPIASLYEDLKKL